MNRYKRFKSCPIVSGCVVNHSQQDHSNYQVCPFQKAHKLLLFSLYGIEVFEESVRLFYANLRLSSDIGEIETLVLGNRLVIIKPLFAYVFCKKNFLVFKHSLI